MRYPARSQRAVTAALVPVATAALAAAIFVADMLTPVGVAVAGLYVAVVLMAARFLPPRGVVLVAVGCAALTVVSDLIARAAAPGAEGVVNAFTAIAAIGVTTLLAVQGQSAEYLTGHVFESSPDWLCIIGRDYRLQRVNPVYARVWGMPAETMIGKHVTDVIETERFEYPVKPALDRCFAGEEVALSGWVLVRGVRSYLAVTYSPLRPHSERVEAILAIARDLTDLMLASDALRAAQADLAHVNRVATMGQLTASIAHEVNQPITAAVLNANTAQRWLGTDPPDLGEARQALGRVIENGGRAGDVIGRIWAVVAKTPPNRSRFDLNEAVSDVIALTGHEALKHGVSVQTQLATDLPSVEGDRVELQQVILNLIMNAIEAMSGVDGGSRELRLSTETDAAGGVLLAVRDSGPGLDPQSAARLFDAFYTTKPEGMGMGLAICRSITEAHGGRLWASANEPRGAVFQLALPAEPAEAGPAEYAG